jgi:hypothetical protein
LGPAIANALSPYQSELHQSISAHKERRYRIDVRERLPERGGGWTSSTANIPCGNFP